MEHLGDITRISGYTVPTVDAIIGGSPCQDLSLAGKRAGLAGERSGLFMEQLRIIKEMRENDVRANGRTGVHVRPRYMVWENVPGAFSSNDGEDLRTVLEETARIADKDAVVPRPPKGKWTGAGCIMGNGWSIAWRILDAQFWGVPQRRRRIALIADLGGCSAPEILFVRQGVCGDTAEDITVRQRAAATTEGGAPFDGCRRIGREDHAYCKGARAHKAGEAPTYKPADAANTLTAFDTGEARANELVVFNGCRSDRYREGTVGSTLKQRDYKNATDVVVCSGVPDDQTATAYGISSYASNAMRSGDPHSGIYVADTSRTLDTSGADPACNQGGIAIVGSKAYVRRLTPTECERLQGYPDGWTDIGAWIDSKGKTHKESSDSARYKALGNSIALPPWKWVLKRLCAQYERDATMASLFDGIGGFPYLWEQINGKGSCLWASEIEEFPMAVTKARIG